MIGALQRWFGRNAGQGLREAPPAGRTVSLEQIADGGERVTHLYPNDCYFAHLSIYHFALPYCRGRIVLDAGSGAGYGARFLAANGAARVEAIEFSELAVAFSRQHFSEPNLTYRQGDITRLPDHFAARSFDTIFTSNVLEHVADVGGFLHGAARLLRNEGTIVFVVPPITNAAHLAADIANRYHVNHWSPHQWRAALRRYFDDVTTFRHGYERTDVALDFGNTPEQTRVTERDFVIEPCEIDDLYRRHTFSAVFVVQRPRPAGSLPPAGEPIQFELPRF